MADGSTKRVEDVRAGDRVESRSEGADERGKTQAATVERGFELRAPSTLLLRFQDGASVEVTAVHPIYVVGRGFTAAGEIRVGDRIAEDRDGKVAVLQSVVRLGTPKPVYNLTVAGTHTYFVRAGEDRLWVHNAKQCGNGPGDIHWGQQGKHIPGDNNFIPGKSELTHPDPQELLNRGAGTGRTVRGTAGQHGGKEIVDFGENIGTYVDSSGGIRLPTNNGTIHYGSSGSHIVPAYP